MSGPKSASGSINYDLEQYAGQYAGISALLEGPEFDADQKARRNFSRPSPSPPHSHGGSVSSSIGTWPNTRPSGDSTDLPRPRGVEMADDRLPSRLTPVPKLPPFAPKQWEAASIRHEIPAARLSQPPPEKRARKAKSMDVMAAAKTMPYRNQAFGSTRSLISQNREKSEATPTTFARRVFEAGKADLMYDLRKTKRFKDRNEGLLDLTTLQRMNQHVLQQKLVEQVKGIGEHGAWMEIGIKDTLHDYCEAIRDLEYMEQCSLRGVERDPFLLSTSKPLDCQLLEEAGLAFGDPKRKLPTPPRLETTKRTSPKRRNTRRLLMALIGGLALIGPFLIMILITGQLARLVAASAFMVGFAIAITIGSELSPDSVALATAAYAAALIIFVGTHPPSYQYGR